MPPADRRLHHYHEPFLRKPPITLPSVVTATHEAEQALAPTRVHGARAAALLIEPLVRAAYDAIALGTAKFSRRTREEGGQLLHHYTASTDVKIDRGLAQRLNDLGGGAPSEEFMNALLSTLRSQMKDELTGEGKYVAASANVYALDGGAWKADVHVEWFRYSRIDSSTNQSA